MSPVQDVFIGLMSGTSLDGISAAVVRFAELESGRFAPDLLAFTTRPYTHEERARLLHAMDHGSSRDYCRLSFDLGRWFAETAIESLADAGVSRDQVRAVGSHGQTLWHEPLHSTWQTGESAVIAERLDVDVVSDFRVRDVAAGGHGAPLVPIADALLFSGGEWRALQNIGGIGNVSIVPPNGDVSGVRAFDTGPGVVVIDRVVRTLFPDHSYDVNGDLARAGTPVRGVVEELLNDPYFASPPPKSTGRELFDAAYVAQLVAKCREADSECSNEDIVATATFLTARSIGDAYHRFMPEPVAEVLVSGGGAKNATLVRMIEDCVAPLGVFQFAERFFDGEAKEAVAFALLAYLHVNHEAGNVARATGARGPRILGKLTPR